jgi:hypothetical protein
MFETKKSDLRIFWIGIRNANAVKRLRIYLEQCLQGRAAGLWQPYMKEDAFSHFDS